MNPEERSRDSHKELPRDEATVSLKGEAGAEVGRNLMRLSLGLVALEDLGPGYLRTDSGYGIRIEPDTILLDEIA